ncbi:MAG: SRPBCC family protein [Sphingomonas sp.]|nr:SRPBCC family protein [Sphingomonas sp.]
MTYPHHFESSVDVAAPPAVLFGEIDDPERLAAHMTQSSMMMAGGAMRYAYDEAAGKAVGSKIIMSGSMLGIPLGLEEVVREREPPFRKTWETLGEPRLLVIGGYRMGFEIAEAADGSRLTVFIDWRDPPPPWRWLGRFLGRTYAKWCVEGMARGAAKHFRDLPAAAAPPPDHRRPSGRPPL